MKLRPNTLHKSSKTIWSKLQTPKIGSQLLIAILLLLHLLPIWGFKYFPSQDGLSHLYNAHVLKSYPNPDNYLLRQVYDLRLTLFPNWSSHLILLALMYLFPPLICEKILLTLCITLIPLSLFYFLNSVVFPDLHTTNERSLPLATQCTGSRKSVPKKTQLLFSGNFLGLVGFIYAFNYLLHMGFYNFTLSISLFFFTLGYWCRRQWLHLQNNLTLPQLAVVYTLLVATYFTHYQSFALLMITISVLAIFSFTYSHVYANYVLTRAESESCGPQFFIQSYLKPIATFLGLMLPLYLLMFSYYLERRGSSSRYHSFEELTDYFLSMKSLVAFRDDHIIIGQLLLAVFAMALVITLLTRLQKIQTRISDKIDRPTQPIWSLLIRPEDGFLLMAIILMVMYYQLPWSKYGGGWINDRVHLYIFLVLLPFFNLGGCRFNLTKQVSKNEESIDEKRWLSYARTTLGSVIVVLSLWHLGLYSQTYAKLNADLTKMMPITEQLPAHSILASGAGGCIIENCPGEWNSFTLAFGQKPKYVDPFGHLECYLAIGQDVAYLNNYEADTDHFPTVFRQRNLPADYLVVRHAHAQEIKTDTKEYNLVKQNSSSRLYRRKKNEPDFRLWQEGRTSLTIDFGYTQEGGRPGIAVDIDTHYQGQGYGWVTDTKRQLFTCAQRQGETDLHGIWSNQDGVFRVDLPNGRYIITSTHCTQEQPSKIDLIANGKRYVRNLSLNKHPVTTSYSIAITNQQLTQVIHPRQTGKAWGWLNCNIKPMSAE